MTATDAAAARCFIAFGSNLNAPRQQIGRALAAIEALPRTELIAVSSAYRSRAIGPGKQPDYINGVCELRCGLNAAALLEHLQQIERQQGRERRERWAARNIDLDILLFGEQCIATPTLKLPHPRMAQRDFVLAPLSELAPDLRLPDGTTIASLLDSAPDSGLERLPDPLTPAMH